MNRPILTKILSSKIEATNLKTITFKHTGDVSPGQFFMIWVPGVDEIPMSVSQITKNRIGITFRNIGEATNALYQLNTGEKIGIRGPYGNGFIIQGKHLLCVGGGTGIGMLYPLVEQARRKKRAVTVILGVKTKDEVFFEHRFKKIGATVLISTDDGSKGYKGFASTLAKEILKKQKIDAVYTCGPEQMMKALWSYCKTILFQASLERYMKCAIGLCGQCCIGKGLRVCVDGPIFTGQMLKTIDDFGVYHRDAAGRKILY